jgi:hypothetical protein
MSKAVQEGFAGGVMSLTRCCYKRSYGRKEDKVFKGFSG